VKLAAAVTVDLAIFTIRDGLEVYLEARDGGYGLPGRELQDGGASLDATARRALRDVTGLDDVYLEQLYTFGGPQRVSVAYFAVLPASWIGKDAMFRPARTMHDLPPEDARVLERAFERLRTKTEYSTVPLRFLQEPFTLSDVQRVYEVLLDRSLDKRNFRRKMLALEALEETEGKRRVGAHRPARLFRLSPSRPHLLKEKGILFPF